MNKRINHTKENDKNQEVTFQERIYVLADEVLKVLKELHQEHRYLLSSKSLAKKMFNKEVIKKILVDYDREGIDMGNRVDPLKKKVDNLLNSFSELLPPPMIGQFSDIKDQYYNKTNPADPTGRLDSALSLIKKYVDSISSRINELEDLVQKTNIFLSEIEKFLINELASTRGKFCEERNFEISVYSDMSMMKQSVDTSSNINTIKRVVFTKIENITKTIEKKKEQDMLRLKETERTLEEMSKKMSYIVNETQAMRDRSLEAEIESLNDNLTKLYNRKAYDMNIEVTLANLDRYNIYSSLVIFDIDYFKKINDNYGHYIGDLTLKKFAQLLKEKLRKNDFIARYGGDEFVCILPHIQSEEARKVAEKIRSFVDKASFIFKGKEVPVTISVGISTFKKGDDVTTIFERADVALYLAKNSGRNIVKTEDDVEKSGKTFSYSLIKEDLENE